MNTNPGDRPGRAPTRRCALLKGALATVATAGTGNGTGGRASAQGHTSNGKGNGNGNTIAPPELCRAVRTYLTSPASNELSTLEYVWLANWYEDNCSEGQGPTRHVQRPRGERVWPREPLS